MVRITNHPDMTIDVYRGRSHKSNKQTVMKVARKGLSTCLHFIQKESMFYVYLCFIYFRKWVRNKFEDDCKSAQKRSKLVIIVHIQRTAYLVNFL